MIGTYDAKDTFMERLKVRRHGPSFQHYHQRLDSEFFEQLTSEHIEKTFEKGKKRARWVKDRRRNEALDLEVLNLAAFELFAPNLELMAKRAADAVTGVEPQARRTEKQRPSALQVAQQLRRKQNRRGRRV